MPHRKAPQRLDKLCAFTIATNPAAMQDKLVDLPLMWINSIFDTICEQFEFYNRCAPSNIFIHPNTESLHHLHVFDLPMESLLEQIGLVCTNLQDLDLTSVRQSQIQFQPVNKLLQRLPQLKRLNLERCWEYNEQHLPEVAANCRLLTHLNLSMCLSVDDDGVRSLIACTKLVKLDVCSTKVTVKGHLFLLNNLHRLKTFEIDDFHEMCHLLAEQKKVNQSLRVCSFTLEHAALSVDKREEIDIAVASFPLLRSLSFWYTSNGGANVNLMLEHVLMQRLTRLKLLIIHGVNISKLARCCPMLERLELVCCTFTGESGEDVAFRKLRVLYMDDKVKEESELETSEADMEGILRTCRNVQELHVHSVSAFSDRLVLKLVDDKLFDQLKALSLIMCDAITPESIMGLVKMENPLKVLNCSDCANVDGLDIDVVEEYVEQNNLDLEIKQNTGHEFKRSLVSLNR